jgi:transcription elongation factor GreA
MATGGQGRMREDKIYLTPEGKAEKEARLHHLRTVKRPQIADYIHEAKEAGDVSESSAYEEAKNEQARLEGEIRELEWLLSHVEVLDPNEVHADGGPRTVRIGSTIEVETDRGSRRTFLMVDTHESDIANGKISNQSPVGKALLGKGEGESAEVTTPGGSVVVYTIRSIR